MANNREHGYEVGQRGAWLGIWTNVALFAVKFLAGIFGRSQAMIADAFHTASDALTSIGVLVGFRIAKKPPDEHHPFGHGRAESIAAKIVSLVLIAVGLSIAVHSAHVLVAREMTEPGSIALIVAIISIIVKEITYRKVSLMGKRIGSTSLKADAMHHRSDALSSVAALIGISAAKMGHTFMDPLAGIIVAGFIIKMGAEVFHMAYDELMDAAPPKELRDEIKNTIAGVEGVEEVKAIMARKMGIEFFIECTIGVDGTKTVKEGHLVTMKVRRDVFRAIPNVHDIIVHVEPA